MLGKNALYQARIVACHCSVIDFFLQRYQ